MQFHTNFPAVTMKWCGLIVVRVLRVDHLMLSGRNQVVDLQYNNDLLLFSDHSKNKTYKYFHNAQSAWFWKVLKVSNSHDLRKIYTRQNVFLCGEINTSTKKNSIRHHSLNRCLPLVLNVKTNKNILTFGKVYFFSGQ